MNEPRCDEGRGDAAPGKGSFQGKLCSIEEALVRVRSAQVAGETVVLCHGCFDIVHPGHVRHLQHAAKQGSRLLVSVSGDAVVAKGDGRPLIPQELRCENLAALDCVDWVAVWNEPTAEALIKRLRPDVYVKGREYEHNRDPRFEAEKAAVQSYGGRVVFTSGEVVFSSTALIRTLESMAHPSHAAIQRLVSEEQLDDAAIDAAIGRFAGRRVLVVGETIIDTYVLCERPEVAGESPVLALRPVERRSFDGGAAIVARHLAALGARPTLVTALRADDATAALCRRLEVEGVEVLSMPVNAPPCEKQRFLVGTSKVMKLDLGDPMVLDERDRRHFVGMVASAAEEHEGLIVTDFGLGLFSAPMLADLCAIVRPKVSVLAGDVSGRRSNLLAMRGMDLLCPSEFELRSAMRDYDEGLSAVAWNMLDQTSGRSAIVTLGDEGLIAFGRPRPDGPAPGSWDGRLTARHVPSLARYAVDQLGCGDALLATATLAQVAGESLGRAAILGSLAAAVEAHCLGNIPVRARDLREAGRRLSAARLEFDPEPVRAGRKGDAQLCAAHARST